MIKKDERAPTPVTVVQDGTRAQENGILFHVQEDGSFFKFVPAETLASNTERDTNLYRKFAEILPKEILDESFQLMCKALETKETIHFHYEIEHDGRPQFFTAQYSPTLDDERNLVGVSANSVDVTERRLLDERLERFKIMVQDGGGAIFLSDFEAGRFVEVNDTASRLLNYSRDELLTLGVRDIEVSVPILAMRETQRFKQRIRNSKRPVRLEGRHRRKDGTTFPVEIYVSSVDFGGREHQLATVRDITDHKKAEKALHESLKEKDLLLKETHHRVKNNLQVISSLLSLQAGSAKSSEAEKLLLESQNRVHSMALIHEKLYQSKDRTKIDFADYLESLLANLSRSYAVQTDKIGLKAKVDSISIEVDKAVTCGLMINELISNSIKHAFPNGRSGQIEIAMNNGLGNRLSLSVKDDGVGLPTHIDFEQSESLGLKLVNLFVRQLKAKMSIQRDNGTDFNFIFTA